ncbi:MAG: PAS domain S-box protein [Fibrobacteres bacterium]|nr:PAS domain S-box protein [Fibrobacterota bacterium]
MNGGKKIFLLVVSAVFIVLMALQHFVLAVFSPITAVGIIAVFVTGVILSLKIFYNQSAMQKELLQLNSQLNEANRSLAEARLHMSVQLKQVEAGEKALRQSEMQFRMLAEQSSLGIAVIQHGKVRFANNTLSTICGYEVDEITGWEPGGFAKVIAPEYLAQIMEHNRMMESGEVTELQQSTVNVITKGGLRKTLQFFARAIEWYGTTANMLSFVDLSGVLSDGDSIRTERERLELVLRSRTAELERTNRELESFAYSVSHDLRAPLRAVTGFARALKNDFGSTLPEEGQKYLFRMLSAAEYMEHLIDAFLRLSKVTRGEMHLVKTDLGSLAQTIMSRLCQDSPERKVKLSISRDMVEAVDPALFQMVLENLLGNAWKYSRGRIEADISFSSMTKNGEKVYCVSDNGAGFDMHYSSKLFMPFQRLHRQSEFEGIGIGLAIAQRIISRHGGKLWAQAEVNKGAAFFFTLPEAG